MKIYLATAFPKAEELAIPYAKKLEEAGIEITCKWWESPECEECDGCGGDWSVVSGYSRRNQCAKCKGTGRVAPSTPETELPVEEQRKFADKDLSGVNAADIVWLLSPGPTGGTGCWFEGGYAHALGKLVVISGHPRTIFSSRLGVMRFATHEEAFRWIAHEAGR